MDKPLWGLRVQAPLGAWVLWFVCCAPNHGFGPQSGLVQRGVLYAAAWGSENHTTALTGEGNAIPLWWLAPPPFPRKRGHYKAPLCCELLMKGLLFRALFCPLNRGGKGTRFVREQSDLRIV